VPSRIGSISPIGCELAQKPLPGRSRGDAVSALSGVYRAGSDHRKDGPAVGW
jgi:hypothetical protein